MVSAEAGAASEDGHDTLTVSLGLGVRARVSEHLLILCLLCVRHRIRSFADIISFSPLINLSSGTVLNPLYTGNGSSENPGDLVTQLGRGRGGIGLSSDGLCK